MVVVSGTMIATIHVLEYNVHAGQHWYQVNCALILFADLRKGYDSVLRCALWKIYREWIFFSILHSFRHIHVSHYSPKLLTG